MWKVEINGDVFVLKKQFLLHLYVLVNANHVIFFSDDFFKRQKKFIEYVAWYKMNSKEGPPACVRSQTLLNDWSEKIEAKVNYTHAKVPTFYALIF